MDTFGVYGHVVDREQERAKVLMDATFDRLLDGAQRPRRYQAHECGESAGDAAIRSCATC